MPAYSKLTVFTALCGLFSSSLAAYTLQDDYSGSNFFGMFDFFTDEDPTHGYVDYVSQSAAQSAGLINTNNNQIYMGVDSKNVASGRGRQSVRLTSKATYNHALIILDLEHMPDSTCGVWPAFWTVGPNWPSAGEIDIIEGVNTQAHNSMTLHTGPGCSISSNTSPNTGSASSSQAFSGSVATSNCDINASGQAQNAGCSISTADKSSYGTGLNAVNGGIYATEWTSSAISIWYFPRSQIPSDISSSPDPSSWGTPLASFASTSCDIDSVIRDQQIVFDTTFCGDWAGEVWSTDSTCSAKAATCTDFVQNNPKAFANAFWTVNSLKVYTGSSSGGNGGNSTASATRSATRSGIVPTQSVSTCIPPLCEPGQGSPTKTSGAPGIPPQTTTFATQTQSQSWGGDNTWTGGQTRSWGGNNGQHTRSWGGGSWRRSVPEATDAPSLDAGGVVLPGPVVRSVDGDGSEAQRMRRRLHMGRHQGKRHGAI